MKSLTTLSRSIVTIACIVVLSAERGCSPIVRLTPTADPGSGAAPTLVVPVEATTTLNPTAQPLPTNQPQPTATIPPTKQPAPTATSAPAQPIGDWQDIPDLPRNINVFAVDPSNPKVIYAGTGENGSGSGVYKSEDGGATWMLTANGLPNGDVQALAINPVNPQQLYAMADIRGAIHTSMDGGANWKQLGTTELFGGFSRRLYTTATDERFLLNLAQPGGLARSRDGGRTWTMLREGLPGDEREVYVLSVAIDPQDANVIYAGTGGFVGQGHGVYKSTDGGDTWSASNRGMIDYRITAVAVDPRNSNIVYAGSDAGELFKSEDGGQKWIDLTEQLGLDPNMHSTLQQIIFDPTQPGQLYLLAAYTGIFIGTTDGTRWQVLKVPSDSGSTSIKTMAIVPGAALHVLVGLEREGGLQYLAQ